MSKPADRYLPGAQSLTGHRAIVTGANTGLGFETTRALAAAGAEVVLAVRSLDRGEAAAAKIKTDLPQAKLTVAKLDLADLSSVREFAAAQGDRRLDVLVNNAGLMLVPERRLTADGFELQMGVNHLGHFALTGLLWTALSQAPGSRVVSLSSIARFGTGALDPRLGESGRYRPMANYGQSKLACLIFALELNRRAKAAGSGVLSIAAHPGYSSTELFSRSDKPAITHRISAWATPALGSDAEHGAGPQIRAAMDPRLKGGEFIGPRFGLRGAPVVIRVEARSADPAAGELLWELSEQRTGLTFKP